MSKPKAQGNCAAKQKQATKKFVREKISWHVKKKKKKKILKAGEES